MFGPHFTPQMLARSRVTLSQAMGRPIAWHRIYTLPKTFTDLFFNVVPPGIAYMIVKGGVTNVQPLCHAKQPWPSSPMPSSPVPSFVTRMCGYHTYAALEHVVEAVPCWRGRAGHSQIVGLLLRYTDGSKASVGQCRLDRLSHPLRLRDESGLSFGFAHVDGRPPYLERVTSLPPPARGKLEWLDLRWGGQLEWWTSLEELKIYYGGQGGPR